MAWSCWDHHCSSPCGTNTPESQRSNRLANYPSVLGPQVASSESVCYRPNSRDLYHRLPSPTGSRSKWWLMSSLRWGVSASIRCLKTEWTVWRGRPRPRGSQRAADIAGLFCDRELGSRVIRVRQRLKLSAGSPKRQNGPLTPYSGIFCP